MRLGDASRVGAAKRGEGRGRRRKGGGLSVGTRSNCGSNDVGRYCSRSSVGGAQGVAQESSSRTAAAAINSSRSRYLSFGFLTTVASVSPYLFHSLGVCLDTATCGLALLVSENFQLYVVCLGFSCDVTVVLGLDFGSFGLRSGVCLPPIFSFSLFFNLLNRRVGFLRAGLTERGWFLLLEVNLSGCYMYET